MGAYIAYLVPTDDGVPAKTYRQKVFRCLVDMEVIDDEEDEEGYMPGAESLGILAKDADAEVGFEFCDIRCERTAVLIPEMPGVSPTCPGCRRKLHDEFYELVNQVMEEEDTPDYSKVKLTCPKCNKAFPLVELDDPVGIYLAKKFVCFNEMQGKLSPKWVKEFEKRTGIKHKVYEYWYT